MIEFETEFRTEFVLSGNSSGIEKVLGVIRGIMI